MGIALGAAGLGLLGGAVQSRNSRKAAQGAAAAQERSAELGIAENRRQFDVTQKNLQPFQQAGTEALGQQQALLGMGDPGDQQKAFEAFNESPGQQFIRKRAQRNLLQNSSAVGGLGGGNVRKALVEQGTGFAQQDFNNQFNRLATLTGGGQAAVNSIGQFGANTASNNANLRGNQGSARASGILGAAQARNQFINSATKAGGTLLGSFS